jgi:hypothetical protein
MRVKLPDRSGCLLQVFLVGLTVAVIVLLATAPLTALAVQHRVIGPPRFAFRLGAVEVISPCPRQVPCDESTPYFGVWLGDEQPDGSRAYRHLFFMYRKPVRRH